MDYYASWPVWKMPKWLGAALGGIFTVIVLGCAWLIVDLTRAPHPRVVVRPTAPAALPIATAPAPPPATVKPTETAAAAPAVVASLPPRKSAKKAHDSSPLHKRAILAKHDTKVGRRTTASDIDRLLGL